MNKTATQQEIILLTNTRFAKKELQKNNGDKESSQKHKLEEACWDGLLINLLPELLKLDRHSNINLWNIDVANNFLDLQFSKAPKKLEEAFCLNPYIFLQHQSVN